MPEHEHFMRRALELASRGTGCVSPNPLVGCVVVRDNKIIGEGWHAVYGYAHAEVNALQDAINRASQGAVSAESANSVTHGATLYVSLEPCNHHGLTPPCTQAIVDAQIGHVVYALTDPNPRAAGGDKRLAAKGIAITRGVLEDEARFLNRFFLKHLCTKLPYVIAKSATSLDGRTATRSGHSQWITGPEARQRGHELRQAVDAIIVGADTVIADNPSLTTRLPETLLPAESIRHPRPVLLDSTGRIPLDTHLLSGALPTRSLIATTDRMSNHHHRKLESRGFDVLKLPHNPDGAGVDPEALLVALGQRGIQSVLLEGGASVHGSFRDAQMIDEIWTFLAPTIIGGTHAQSTYAGLGSDTLEGATELCDVHVENVGRDVLIRARVARKAQLDATA